MELYFTFSPAEFSARYKDSYIPYPCGTALYCTSSPAELPIIYKYSKTEIHPIFLWNRILHSPQWSFQWEIRSKIHFISLWNCILLSPLRSSQKRKIQSEIHFISLWNCILRSPLQCFRLETITENWKYIPYSCGSVFSLSPAELSIIDIYSHKYIPNPCGTAFYTLPAEFSKEINTV